ncbi:major facilitator superfamily transporter [Sporothrix brasiliensis 5110]|uniref:Major facilitator superfamily transporter n=1 Tax=Sporothrix brasiliensis 5110 TaxID=1398154 RepID=A0A0C2FFD4_9PEZI|nr:major facilitator superfamily transporter [Sporothrix brasiliensis 5110]KIH89828.1 major facilitator superfamily transporter [Sporothrix brasiliensis 5110]
MDKRRQPSAFADIADTDEDFEKYLERELAKLAESKAAEKISKTEKAEKAVKAETSRPSSPPKTAYVALSAFPPKPRANPGLVLAVPPSPPSKDAPSQPPHTVSATPVSLRPVTPPKQPPSAPPTAPLPPPPAVPAGGSPPRYQPPKPLRVDILPVRGPMGGSTATRPRPMSYASNMSATSMPMSMSTTTTTRRPIKYGKGRHARTELVPQPSDDAADPLNWPRWKKEAHYGTLLLFVALVGVMKTALFAVHSQVATQYAVSYTAAAALTGAPLMVSAGSGFACLVASRLWGKRPLYLASAALLFIGTMWAITVPSHNFAQCMAARVFQGLGWGAFDVLVLGSVHDTYFAHERDTRTAAVDLVAVACTWGGPLLGGVVSTSTASATFGTQFAVLGGFLVVATLGLVLAVPETTYDRSYYSLNTPVPLSAWSNKALPLRPRTKFSSVLSREAVRDYVTARNLRPVSYASPSSATDVAILLQVPRAMAAPTTALLTLVTLLPFCALWGMAASVGLFFAPLPFDLSPRGLGALFTGPWLLATVAVLATTGGGLALLGRLAAKVNVPWPSWTARLLSTARHNMVAVAAGSLLVLVGLLTFGLYIASCMSLMAAAARANHASFFAVAAAALGAAGDAPAVHLPAVSFLLGLLAAGTHLLDATVRPMVRRSAQFTSPNLIVAQRNTVDMCGGLLVWRTLVSGAFVVALPNAVWFWTLLKAASIGLVAAHAAVAAVVVFAWWRYDETVRRLDGQVMRSVDLGMLKGTGSFFDTD